MTNVPLVESDIAPPSIRSVYEEFCRRMQFPSPPNFITVQGHSNAATRGIWELLKNVLLGGTIPRWKKELIIVAISRDRNCQYCEAAHLACCTMLGVGAEYMVRDVNGLPDAVLRDSILFAMKSARDPRGLTDSDFAVLAKHGIPQSEMIELISVSGLAVYLNIIADATAVETDAMMKGG